MKSSNWRALQLTLTKYLLLAFLGWSAPTLYAVEDSSDKKLTVDLPAQPVQKSIAEIEKTFGINVNVAPELLSGEQGLPVEGNVSAREALERVLGKQYTVTQSGQEVRIGKAGQDSSASDEAAGDTQVLATTSVLGTRQVAAPLSNVPASITILPPEEIEKQQATAPRIEDILTRTVPGFNPTNNGVRQIRGRTAQVFINGVPVNEQLRASSGADINLISIGQLNSVEVSRGASSAYGFGSPGGIIALNTARAESEELTFTSRISTSVNTNHISDSEQFSLYQSVAQIRGNFDFHVGANIGYDGLDYDADGDKAVGFRGPSRLGNGKERIGGLDWSLGYDFEEHGQLRLTGTYQHVSLLEAYDSDFMGVYRGPQSSIVRTPAADDDYRRSHTLNLTYENLNVGDTAVKLELLNSRTYTEAHSLDGNRVARDEQTNVYYGLRSSATTPLPWLHPSFLATYGLDYLHNRYYRPVYFEDTGEFSNFFSPDVALDSYAPYFQGNMDLGKFHLTAGVRHEEYKGDVKSGQGFVGGDINSFDITLFNAGVVYKLNKQHDLFATFSQGAEISQLSRAALRATSVEEIDPQPARSNQYEFGLRRNAFPVQYSLAAFYTESDLLSALQPNPADPTGPLIPLREPRQIFGIEGTLNWNINKQWGVGGTLSWQKGNRETDTGNREITAREVPPLLASAFIDFKPISTWTNTLQFDYFDSADRFGNSMDFEEGDIRGVLLAHFSSATKVGPGELRVGVRNLFNKKYFGITNQADNAGFFWIPEEGRRLSATYLIKW